MIVLSAIGVVCATVLPDGNIIRIIFALPIVIFLPGYAFVSVMWPGNGNRPTQTNAPHTNGTDIPEGVSNMERLALSFGLSIAISSFIGIGLNYLWEISIVPILSSLFVFIIMTGILGWIRRMQVPDKNRFSIPFTSFSIIKLASASEDKVMGIVMGIILILSGLTMAYVLTTDYEGENYTEFYVLGQNGTVESLPLLLYTNENGTLVIGTVNHEYESMDYIIVIDLLNMTGSRVNRTLYSYNVTLDHEEMNEEIYTFQIPEAGNYRMEFYLYSNDETTPYRDGHLWIEISESGGVR